MAFSMKRNIYESLPLAIKQGLCLIPFSWWAGKAYRETFARGPWFDRASWEELLHYQERQLGKGRSVGANFIGFKSATEDRQFSLGI